jgi:hypothetical protein
MSKPELNDAVARQVLTVKLSRLIDKTSIYHNNEGKYEPRHHHLVRGTLAVPELPLVSWMAVPIEQEKEHASISRDFPVRDSRTHACDMRSITCIH